MNYLLFNSDILISDGKNVRRVVKDNIPKDILGSIDQASLCVVDVDVLIAAAVEIPVEKKDSILVRKFKELYQHEAYIIQDERIDTNLFQVIGIKEQKVREVYSLIPSQKIESFIPYSIALRNTLINKKVELNKTLVFVDDLGGDRLLTVFDGLKFSRTRVIADNGEDILPEIKRSQIDFFKKNEEYLSKKNTDFVIVVNSQTLVAELSKNEENLPVEYLNITYPALEGLKEINTQIKYRLPEEIFKKRKEIELKKNLTTAVLSLCMVAVGVFYFLFNKIEFGLISSQCDLLQQSNERLDEKLSLLDRETYREDLRSHKFLNYGVSFLSVLDLIPANYKVYSFKFTKSDHWRLDVSLFADSDVQFDPIPKIRILKDADIKDIFVNDQPRQAIKDNFMNQIFIPISLVVLIVLVDFGISAKSQVENARAQEAQLQKNNSDMKQKIQDKEHLVKSDPVLLSTEYSLVMNQIRLLESYSGTNMDVGLEGALDTDDISDYYVDTPYKGVRGLKIKIVVDKFSKETDMGAVLDGIHLLEKNTDFMASEISKDNNNLVVKGEIYGL